MSTLHHGSIKISIVFSLLLCLFSFLSYRWEQPYYSKEASLFVGNSTIIVDCRPASTRRTYFCGVAPSPQAHSQIFHVDTNSVATTRTAIDTAIIPYIRRPPFFLSRSVHCSVRTLLYRTWEDILSSDTAFVPNSNSTSSMPHFRGVSGRPQTGIRTPPCAYLSPPQTS